MKTVDHTPSNHGIAAMLKRETLARAAFAWIKSDQTDEDDIALEAALRDTGTLSEDEAILEIFMDDIVDVVVVLESGTEAICIDIESGNTARGTPE